MKKLIFTLTVVSLFLLLAPVTALAQEPVQCDVEYTVQAGDWLSKVADKYFGDPLDYDLIVDANNANADDAYTNIDNPDLIEPGWLLCIPAGSGSQVTPAPNIADFDTCSAPNLVGGAMGAAFDPPDDSPELVETYVQEPNHGCVARLEYNVEDWAAFWMKLNGFNASEYNTLTFWARGDSVVGIPPEFKVELKRNDNNEISIHYVSGLTDSWQQFSIPLDQFGPFFDLPPLNGLDNLSELVFTFELDRSGRAGIMYLDDINFE